MIGLIASVKAFIHKCCARIDEGETERGREWMRGVRCMSERIKRKRGRER